MARGEYEREDLMREATALRERVELAIPGWPEPVTCGFRENQYLSVYFGNDPVYQFDDGGALRRAFADGFLYVSQGTTLGRLARVRTEEETNLLRHDLTSIEYVAFVARLAAQLWSLKTALEDGVAQLKAQVPAQSDLRPRLLAALREILKPPLRLSAPVNKRKR